MFRKGLLPALSFVWAAVILCSPAFAQIGTGKHFIDANFDEGFSMLSLDFDKDGDVDVVAASRLTGIEWFENTGSGFVSHSVTSTFSDTWSIHAGDLDNDGDLDIAAGAEETSETAWFEQINADSFTEHLLDNTPNISPHSVWITDLDGDNDNDILVAEWTGGNIVWWENDGNANFTRNVLDGNFGSAHSVTAADMDNDGDIDVVAAGGAKTAWWENDGNGSFARTNLGTSGGFGVFIFDIDQDGFKDIIRTERVNFDLDWFRNNGGTSFTLNTILSNFGESWSASAADFDLDGDMDIVAASYVPKDPNFLQDHISLFVNDGSNSFSEQVLETFNIGDRPRVVATADIDGDGDPDIPALITRTDDVLWYEILGSPVIPKSLTILQPNGAEKLQAGVVFPIQWTSTGPINNVKIEYSQDGGTSWIQLIGSVANNGSFDWTVPEISTDSALVRISDVDAPDTSDVSDSLFTILPTAVTLVSPNGGESFFGGSLQPITWNTTGVINLVNLEYSTDGGTSWQSIVNAVANTGSYDWTVPNITSDNALVRITDAGDLTRTDTSDSVFSIIATGFTITSPIPDTLIGHSLLAITWTTSGNIDSVNLAYSVDSGLSWISIADSLPNSGAFDWTVPDIDATVHLRLSSTNDDSIFIVSKSFVIDATGIVVSRPNGGEQWLGGATERILWFGSETIDSVKIELSLNNGADWMVIAESAPNTKGNTSHFDWNVPDTVSNAALIRISDAADGVPADTSDAVFSIVTGTITVTSPNGGESWPGLSAQTITWESMGDVDTVKIEYSTNNGSSWNTIVPAVANSGSYVWEVPNMTTLSAKVRVSQARSGNPSDESDAVFSIVSTSITVTAPNGGESLTGLTLLPITWNSTGILDSLRIEYSVNNGATWQTITSTAPNTGTYEWIVADVLTDSALIRISDAVDSNPSDVSDAVFSIEPGTASLTLTSPNGGEFWNGGSEHDILWSSVGPVSAVKIEYSFSNGRFWNVITDGTANSGSYLWTVPDVQTDSALVRISEAGTGQAFDISDAVFTIISSSITVLAPDGGEILMGNTGADILWASAGGISQVRLEYSLDLGATWNLIEAGAPNTGRYVWSVPNVDSDSALVRVSDTADGVPADVSNAHFSIRRNITGISVKAGGPPAEFRLSQNYPNPFNPQTNIDFSVKNQGAVFLAIYNIKGERVRVLFDGELAPGVYTSMWEGRDDRGRILPSGLYIYRIHIGDWQASRKLLFVK